MTMRRIVFNTLKVIGLLLSLAVLAISSMTGMLMNYLFVFLMLSALLMVVSLIVALVKKQVRWNVAEKGLLGTFFGINILRNATWIVIGGCISVAVLPVQFSPEDFSDIMLVVWSSVVLLCVLDWVPRERTGQLINATLCVFLIFSAYQFAMSTISPRTANRAELNLFADQSLYVMQGGNSALINHHYFAGSQKYALDLIDPKDGMLPLAQVMDLKQYATFGRELYSPVQGLVVSVMNTLPDQKVGETDARNLAGNHVVIRMAPNAFLLMAHLQNSSVSVAVGDSVDVGQRIARIGNSGNTTQPHLHIQAMTDADFMNPSAKPLPLFINVDEGHSNFFKRNDVVPARF